MARQDKAAAIAELADRFRGSSAAVLTEYRGLTVKQISDLRKALRGNATYAVVKNTLTDLAAKEADVTAFDGRLFARRRTPTRAPHSRALPAHPLRFHRAPSAATAE